MKKWILHIVLVSVLGMLAASCSQEADDPTQTSDEKVQVYFTIALDDAPASRAGEWNDNMDNDADYPAEQGTDIDNVITSLQVLLFENTTDGAFIGKVNNTFYYKKENGIYEFVGDIEIGSAAITDDSKLNCKVMVLANSEVEITDNMPNLNSTEGVLNNKSFKFTSNPSSIPMWGIKAVFNIDVKPGYRSELPDIYLLRSMAKIEVIMEATKSDGSSHTISDITLNGYNDSGYVFPTGYATIASTESMNREGVLRVKADNKESTTAFTESTKEGYKCHTIYVPEYKNLGNGATPATITVKVNGKEYTIYFKNYETNTETTPDYDIVRNHIYRFRITQVNEDIEVEYMVANWNDGSTLNYGEFTYPTYHNTIVSETAYANFINTEGAIAPTKINETPTMIYVAAEEGQIDESQAFSAWFKLNAPMGKKWTPTIINQPATEYVIRVYLGEELKYSTFANDNKQDATVLVAADEWYNIKVIPSKPLDTGVAEKIFKLGITSSLSWVKNGEVVEDSGSPMFLFINGQQNDISWQIEGKNTAGDDPTLIEIKQIEVQSASY